MKSFFKYLFASALGTVLALFVFLGLSTMILGGIISSLEDEKEVKVKDNSILHLKLNKSIVDRASEDPFAELDFGPFQGESQFGLNDLLTSLENAKDDDRIKGVLLEMNGVSAGMAVIEEFRNGLIDFKESGKYIIAYSENGYSQGAYYLASVADKIYMYPEAEMDFKGIGSELTFFKNMMDKLGIEAQVIRPKNNRFKSAMEPFMYDKASDANREQVRKYIGSMWDHMVEGVSKERGISVGELNIIADSLTGGNTVQLKAHGMIDDTRYRDELISELMDSADVEDRDDLHMAKIGSYIKYRPAKDEDDTPEYKIKEKVAVIYAAGEIQTGSNGDGTMGSTTIANAIKDARLDSNVKAIVLRVNSPGGSALASDIMWRETQLAKDAKPFIVSMGNLAASGGYYISCGADYIFAQPNTITGSIGVFGMIPNFGELMEDKIGITTDTVQTNAHSAWGSVSRPLSDYEFNVVQGYVETVYDTFLTRVSNGRGMSKAAVDNIAQGRVWTGKDAKDLDLVDELGGLEDAIAYAVEQADLEEYKIRNYPEQKDPVEEMLKGLSGDAEEAIIKRNLGTMYPYVKRIQQVQKMEGIYARIPYFLDLHY